MSANSCPDETIVLDFGVFRRGLIRRLHADRVICEQDVAVIRAFDTAHQALGQRLKVRKAFDSLMRNGLTRRTGDKAREADIQIVVTTDGQVADVIPLFAGPIEPEAA